VTFYPRRQRLEILDLFIVLPVQTGPFGEIVLRRGRFEGGRCFEQIGLESALLGELAADGQRQQEVQFPGLVR